MSSIPDLQLFKVRQRFADDHVADVPARLRQGLAAHSGAISTGQRVAIAVGSRGIANLPELVHTTVSFVKEQGATPFIIPAMGSHGGATENGQTAVLKSLGITPDSMGAPLESSMEVVELPRTDSAVPIYMDRIAAEADGIIIINRIKPHTSFHGELESGLGKMCVVGLGKQAGAMAIHAHGARGLREHLPAAARAVVATGHIRLGIGIVENALDQTTRIRVLDAATMLDGEPGLLAMAKAHMPSLPTNDLDVLIVDEMGKNISGVGMDPNIIGRIRIQGEPEPATPRIKSIVVTDLTDMSHGNATGVGLADVITQRLLDKIDLPATYANVNTSRFLERAKIPFTAKTPVTAYEAALRACSLPEAQAPRVLRVRNTLHLQDVYVSAQILAEIENDVDVIADAQPAFVCDGELRPF